MAYEPKEIQEWKQDLESYNQKKKTANPEFFKNPNFQIPKTHQDVKTKEYAFDPILNRYRTCDKDNAYFQQSIAQPKMNKAKLKENAYDIITLENAPLEDNKKGKSYSIDSHAQPYNIVTNAIQIPNHKAFRVRMKKINEEIFRDYNIINNQYWKQNSEKSKKDWDLKKAELEKKYTNTHDFDPICCNYYDNEKEKQFLVKQEEIQKQIFELKNSRLPKSYKFREPINLNHEKNIFVSEGFEAFKCREKAKIKRFQKKYEMENYFRELGYKIDDRNDQMKNNKYFAQRFLEEYQEGFDPITLESSTRIQETLKFALGNKLPIVREKQRPKKKFRFLY